MYVLESRVPHSGALDITHRFIAFTVNNLAVYTVVLYVPGSEELDSSVDPVFTEISVNNGTTITGNDILTTGAPGAGQVLITIIPATGTSPLEVTLTFGTVPDTDTSRFFGIFASYTLTVFGATTEIDIYPADRCIWKFADVASGGYEIVSAAFYPGYGDDSDIVPLSAPRLGVIGKSGRFVPITD